MYIMTSEDHRKRAEAILAQLDALVEVEKLTIPGRFVYSPPADSRLCVKNLDELHEARGVLRKKYGWQDAIANKFYSCGIVIATYRPAETVKLPLPFELWLEAPPETFPQEVLGKCKLVLSDTVQEYDVICEI